MNGQSLACRAVLTVLLSPSPSLWTQVLCLQQDKDDCLIKTTLAYLPGEATCAHGQKEPSSEGKKAGGPWVALMECKISCIVHFIWLNFSLFSFKILPLNLEIIPYQTIAL